jgi:hypothetical protein
MSRSPYLLITSGLLGAAGCTDDHCGPSGAPTVGIVAAGTGVSLTYGTMSGGLNNDCPAADQPNGVVSMTIDGAQDGGPGLFGICISRPDKLANGPQNLGPDAPTSEIRLVGISGNANGCTFAIDTTKPITGTATSSGLCGNGADSAGFALVLDGALTLKRTCGATVDSVAVTLRGRVAVAKK